VNGIWMIHLPAGPTAHFKLTSLKLCKDIRGRGNPSDHRPELILNNFNTRLGAARPRAQRAQRRSRSRSPTSTTLGPTTVAVLRVNGHHSAALAPGLSGVASGSGTPGCMRVSRTVFVAAASTHSCFCICGGVSTSGERVAITRPQAVFRQSSRAQPAGSPFTSCQSLGSLLSAARPVSR
jgi:hypothetical protein